MWILAFKSYQPRSFPPHRLPTDALLWHL